jgi:hypothetical protein
LATVDDMHSEAAAERLLEESWESRTRRLPRRELVTELVAAGLFLLAAGALLLAPRATAGFDPALAALLVALYALVSRVEFPVGVGYVVPSQLGSCSCRCSCCSRRAPSRCWSAPGCCSRA